MSPGPRPDGRAVGVQRRRWARGIQSALRSRTASAVRRRREEAEGAAEIAEAVSARVEEVREVEGVEEVERTQSSRMRSAVMREEEG